MVNKDKRFKIGSFVRTNQPIVWPWGIFSPPRECNSGTICLVQEVDKERMYLVCPLTLEPYGWIYVRDFNGEEIG
jgi:hypothetical protein